jgi:hypothetical protein
MVMEMNIEIPASHRLVLELPASFPVGRAKIAVTPSRARVRAKKSVGNSGKQSKFPVVSQEMLDTLFEGSITQSLTGVLHLPDMTLEEIRAERLRKYDV